MTTLYVNLFGGPGTGKSTNAALLFGLLKQAGVNVELVTEYAKDLVWEERDNALAFQPYVFGKQFWRLERLRGKVDVVITDSPLLLSTVYGKEGQPGVNYLFRDYVRTAVSSFTNLNVFLIRDREIRPYNPAGRKQTEEEAIEKDVEIRTMLGNSLLPWIEVPIQAGTGTAEYLCRGVLEELHQMKQVEELILGDDEQG